MGFIQFSGILTLYDGWVGARSDSIVSSVPQVGRDGVHIKESDVMLGDRHLCRMAGESDLRRV